MKYVQGAPATRARPPSATGCRAFEAPRGLPRREISAKALVGGLRRTLLTHM
jgi:hypothetical protein